MKNNIKYDNNWELSELQRSTASLWMQLYKVITVNWMY